MMKWGRLFFPTLRILTGRLLLLVALVMPLEGLAQTTAAPETYRLSPGDELQASVPGRPDLSTLLVLDGSGRVQLPQIGDVELADLTLTEAEMVLRQKLRLADLGIDNVNLELLSQAGAFRLFVIGDVAHPGEYGFAQIPSLWELVRACGGPNATANLSMVRIISQVDGTTEVQQIDMSGVMDGSMTTQVTLKDNDTLIVPALLEGVSGVPRNDGVQVFGGVALPTVVALNEPLPLLDILMMAGAPSPDGNLKKIWLVHQTGDKYMSRLVNMELYMKEGDPMGNPLVYPGDSVQMEISRPSWVRQNVPFILGSMAAVATIYLAYDRIVND